MGAQSGFNWSLKPLFYITRILIGAPSSLTQIYSIKSLLFLLFGCFILLLNLLINGPRNIDIERFEWMETFQFFDNGWQYFEHYPEALLELVTDVTYIIFFLAIPLIHLIFLLKVFLSRMWTSLSASLQKIQIEMELNAEFHRKYRRRCLVALLFLILVKQHSYRIMVSIE